ncbi:YdbC family protein [Mitsuokella sp.]|uniref:YdbC family protein n=1 Tax=Mitsuokella sp. TaxID=2049034 RepID=UPI003D7D5924
MPKEKKELNFEIANELGVISERTKGWKLEFNRVMWNGRDPKYDIRTWSPDHEKMGKGITLSEEELRTLKKLLDQEIKILDE